MSSLIDHVLVMKTIKMLIILLSIIKPTFAVYCNLCSGGEEPRDPNAKLILDIENEFVSNKNQVVSCHNASLMANNKIFSNCTELHQRTKSVCGCDVERQCSLCKDGKLPNPSKIVAGKACGNWENEANKDFISNCGVYQNTYGNFCGCNDDTLKNFCYICGNSTLPNSDKKIQYEGGKEEYCLEAEQKKNVQTNLNCSEMQSTYSDACSCNDIQPKNQTSSGNIFQINAQKYWISFMFVVVQIV